MKTNDQMRLWAVEDEPDPDPSPETKPEPKVKTARFTKKRSRPMTAMEAEHWRRMDARIQRSWDDYYRVDPAW